MTELKEIIARIKETAVDAGIIMIEGELWDKACMPLG